MTLDVEHIVDGSMGGEEALSRRIAQRKHKGLIPCAHTKRPAIGMGDALFALLKAL